MIFALIAKWLIVIVFMMVTLGAMLGATQNPGKITAPIASVIIAILLANAAIIGAILYGWQA